MGVLIFIFSFFVVLFGIDEFFECDEFVVARFYFVFFVFYVFVFFVFFVYALCYCVVVFVLCVVFVELFLFDNFFVDDVDVDDDCVFFASRGFASSDA